MALINCPECSKSISDQSTSCPSCGFPTARTVPSPLQQVEDNNSRASSRQRQKNSGCSGAIIFLLLIIVAISYWLVNSYDNYTEKARQYSEEPSETHEEPLQVENSLFDSELTQIPMLLSGSSEDGRYFVISHFTSYELEHIEYVRRGNESDSYGQMQINCEKHEIRKSSSESFKGLPSAELGDWHTPTPDWTDQDIINFICKKQSVPKQPQLNTERNAVEEPVSTSETFVSIPMSDSFENGRYFLTSQTTENGIENIEYIREGNDNTSYAKMQIKCLDNEIRKYSADNSNALQSADMGDWYTPTPDWTDQDIVNFICK
ncbi:hypothetical protein [Psychrobacter sp. ANT_WB68]|uniref:hypothetical protein n=1 Tax=Psychrobacter sp. ANT_WB68 TaxID=2597355 RepID=UPI0011F252DB|nr:hypothetical protein [Psychrobacter sp. ANT_WB68]KAA0915210.1 hypothetical protein FQ084_01205 [Psychrobacter sp. ANT_WB68]